MPEGGLHAKKRGVLDVTFFAAILIGFVLASGASAAVICWLFNSESPALFDFFAGGQKTLSANNYTHSGFSRIVEGMTKKEVEEVLGLPLKIKDFGNGDIVCDEYVYDSGRMEPVYDDDGCTRTIKCIPVRTEWHYSIAAPNAVVYQSSIVVISSGIVTNIVVKSRHVQ